MYATLDQLKVVTAVVLRALGQMQPEVRDKMLTTVKYHGFQKSRFPEAFLRQVLTPQGLTSQDVQVEVVYVDEHSPHALHHHVHTNAMVAVLGGSEHFDEPVAAEIYEGIWVNAEVEDLFLLPAGRKHGFMVGTGGRLWFLSVQSPPIVGEGRDEDFVED